jgi:hypothetical protein
VAVTRETQTQPAIIMMIIVVTRRTEFSPSFLAPNQLVGGLRFSRASVCFFQRGSTG